MKYLIGLTLTVLVTAACSAADWPQWRGPTGNGNAQATPASMITSWAEAKELWTSSAVVPGTYEGDARKSKPGFRATSRVPAGYASPVVHDGKVFLAYYVPNGPVYSDELVTKHTDLGGFGREAWYTDADEVVLCLDAASGRIIWRRGFAERAFNHEAGFNKGGCQLTAAAVDGRVFAIGPSARIYALDADTGVLLWQSDTGIRARYVKDLAAGSREARGVMGGRNDFAGCVSVSGNTVAVSDHQEFKGGPRTMANGGNGLVGFDVATGRRRWYVPAAGGRGMLGATPIPWRHDDKDWFISAGTHGVVLIDAVTGAVAWTHAEATFDNAGAVHVDLLICSVDKQLACLRISPTGVDEVWRGGEPTGFTAQVVHDGHLYAMGKNRIRCIDLATGTTVATVEHESPCGSMVGQNGIIAIATSNRAKVGLSLIKADPQDFRIIAQPKIPFANSTTPAWADGILYIRGRDRLHAYDCRK